MKCEQCGAEIKSGEIFCRVCGARVPASSASTAEKEAPPVKESAEAAPSAATPQEKERPRAETSGREGTRIRGKKSAAGKPARQEKKPKKKFIFIGAAAVAAVVVIIVVLALIFGGGRGSAMRLDPERPFAVMYDNNAIVYDAEGGALLNVEHGVDGVVTSVWNGTIVLDRGRVSAWNAGGDTVYRDGEYLNASAAVISANGEVLEFTDLNDGENEGMVRFAGDAADKLGDLHVVDGTVAMSPDGSRAAYNIFDAASDAEHSMLGETGEKGERLLDCERIYALSNDGAYVYFENNGRFYVEKDGERTRLCELTDLKLPIVMNSVGDEIIFATYSDGVHYVHGGVNDKISGVGDLEVYGPVQFASERRAEDTVSVARTETFAGSVLMLGDMLYGVEPETFKTTMIDYCLSAAATEDGKRLAYADVNGRLHLVTDPCGERKDTVTTPDERATAVYANSDLSEIYFTNVRDELWRLSGGRTEMVSADVGNLCLSGGGELYFLYDGVVLCRADGTDRVSLERTDGFVSIESVPQGVVVHLAGDTAKYFRDGAAEGKTLAKSGPAAGSSAAGEPSAPASAAATVSSTEPSALPTGDASMEPSAEESGEPTR